MMEDYSIDQLRDPSTYDDGELATGVRKIVDAPAVAEALGHLRIGERKRALLAGHYPELVREHVVAPAVAREQREQRRQRRARDQVEALDPAAIAGVPDSLTVTREGDTVVVGGIGFDADLHRRLKSAGAYWDGRRHGNTRCWRMPVDKAGGLRRILTNWGRERQRQAQLLDDTREHARAAVTAAALDRLPGMPSSVVVRVDHDHLVIAGTPYDDALVRWLREAGGWWSREARLWYAPLDQAERVCQALQAWAGERAEAQAQREAARSAARAAWSSWVPPRGYRAWLEESTIVLCGAFDADLHQRLKRAGGRWDGRRGSNRRVWFIDLAFFEDLRAALADYEPPAPQEAERDQGPPSFVELLERAPRTGSTVDLDGHVVVVTHQSRVFRVDADLASVGHPHLVGCEGERAVRCYVREATDAEASQHIEQRERAEAMAERAREREAERATLAQRIREHGERPEGPVEPEGTRVLNRASLYGTGDWFVVGSRWIWYVVNNGADGDNWAANNVVTGGAGAIGWRVAYDYDLARRLRQLAGGDEQ